VKIFSLLYNSFLWGLVIATAAFQNEWLEMRMDIGILIPIVMLITLTFWSVFKKSKRNILDFKAKLSVINLLLCTTLMFCLLGFERITTVPASIIREVLKISETSFNIMNTILLTILIVGLVVIIINDHTFSFCAVGVKIKNSIKRNKGKIISVALVLGIYFFIPPIKTNVNQAIFILKKFNVDMVRKYILSFGVLAPIVSFLLMILQSVIAPLPAFIITFANAGLFGWVKGAILSWSSAMAGAALCYYIAKFLGRDFVERLTTKTALEKIDEFFKSYGKYAILIARLLPFISFDIVSYAAGLTSIGFWPFFIATGIGQLPATIVYSYIGGMLSGTVKTFVVGLLMLFAISTLVVLLKKIWDDKKSRNISSN